MRNLKKFLALVLTMMMVMGLMVTANASTDFTDDALIGDQYREAAEVLSTIGVYEGDNGNFAPKDNIRRAEFSILLYRMGTGDVAGKWAALGAQDDQFTDVITGDNRNFGWAAPYVNYAASMTWFEGDNGVGGTFRPGDPVSYHEVLICMLRVLGLADDITDPATWKFETADRATRLGLTEGIDSLVGYATREEVAQMVLNTLVYTTETGYIWTVYIDDGKNAADASAGEAASGNNRYDPGIDTLLYQGPDYDRAMLYAQSQGAIVDSKRNTAGSLADDNFNGLTRIEDTDQYARHTITWTDNDHSAADPVAKFLVAPDFYYNGDFTVADQEALEKAVGSSNINVWYNGVPANTSPNYWQSANPSNDATGLWYGNNKSTSIGLPGIEIYVYKNDNKTYDVVAREALVAQVTQAADAEGELKVAVYEATSGNAGGATVGNIEFTVNGDSGTAATAYYYDNEVYGPLAASTKNDVVAVYMVGDWDRTTTLPTSILGVETLTPVSATISHVRDNGLNINSTLEVSGRTDPYPVANKALWTSTTNTATGAFGTVQTPGFNNNRDGRRIDVGTALLYTLNGNVLFIDVTTNVATAPATYAYLWDTKDLQDNTWKTEQDPAMHYARLFLDDSKTYIESLVTYVDPKTGQEYTDLNDAAKGAFNVDEGGILVQYRSVAASGSVPAHIQLSLPSSNTNETKDGPARGSLSSALGNQVAVRNNVAQGNIVEATPNQIKAVAYDNATIFYVVNTVPSTAGAASKYEVVNVFHGVKEIPSTLYVASSTEFQVVYDNSKMIGNNQLVRSVVIKNPGDGSVTSLSGVHFIVGDTSGKGVTYHTVRLSSTLKVDYYGYPAVVGNTGEVIEVWVNKKIDASAGYTLIGQDISKMQYDTQAARYGYTVLDTSAGSAVWTAGNDASPDMVSSTNGSIDGKLFTKFTGLVVEDKVNDVIALSGTPQTAYMVSDIPIYRYDYKKGTLEKIDFDKLSNGMEGYAVLETNALGTATGVMLALYVTDNP